MSPDIMSEVQLSADDCRFHPNQIFPRKKKAAQRNPTRNQIQVPCIDTFTLDLPKISVSGDSILVMIQHNTATLVTETPVRAMAKKSIRVLRISMVIESQRLRVTTQRYEKGAVSSNLLRPIE